MSSYLDYFLTKEITCLPQIFDNYVGKFYNNKICNGATWIFFMWNVIHYLFDQCFNILLRRMKYKEYVRLRLKNSLWYLGFYGCSLLYCFGTLIRNNIDLHTFRISLIKDGGPVEPHLILGYILYVTFFLHCIVWEYSHYGMNLTSLSYIFITGLLTFSYFTRRVELYLTFVAVYGLSQFVAELVRSVTTLLRDNAKESDILLKTVFICYILILICTHLLFTPIILIIPMWFYLISNINPMLITLNIFMVLWFITQLFNNPLYRYVQHWLYHNSESHKTICPGSMVECSLFFPRDDAAFNLAIITEEIEERKNKMIKKRRPKNKAMLVQTLKCVVALRRKLALKRASETSDSDSDISENNEDDNEENSETDEDLESESCEEKIIDDNSDALENNESLVVLDKNEKCFNDFEDQEKKLESDEFSSKKDD